MIQIQNALGVSPTGQFDDETVSSIRQFQRQHQLIETGEIDETTWLALKESSLAHVSKDRYSRPIKVELITPTGPVKISYEQLLHHLGQYGATVQSEFETSVQVATVARYSSGDFEVSHFIQTVPAGELTTLCLSDYPECLMYQTKHQSTPLKLEFILYLPDLTTYKWYFEIEKGVQYVTT